MLEDRRQYQRVIPNQPLFVRCGESQSRLLFDLCEEGLALDSLNPEYPAEVVPLVFDLPDGCGHIRTKGEVAWTNESQNRAGLRFVDLADTSRQQLREWISASFFHTTDVATAERDPVQPPLLFTHGIDSAGLLVRQAATDEVPTPHRTRPYVMLFVLGALSLFSGVVFGRHYTGAEKSGRVSAIMTAGKVREIPAPDSTASVEPPPAPTPSLPVTLPLNLPGFVLQVAAMKDEDNADALAKTLQKRNFPAFVFKRGANAFYRVAVGAYSDPDSADRVKDELKAQGFKSILKHWSPA